MLQQKNDEATTEYEEAVLGITVSTDNRVFRRLREQQRLIEVQQHEIDQIRYEKELLQEETKRLREMAHRGGAMGGPQARDPRRLDPAPLGRLHHACQARD